MVQWQWQQISKDNPQHTSAQGPTQASITNKNNRAEDYGSPRITTDYHGSFLQIFKCLASNIWENYRENWQNWENYRHRITDSYYLWMRIIPWQLYPEGASCNTESVEAGRLALVCAHIKALGHRPAYLRGLLRWLRGTLRRTYAYSRGGAALPVGFWLVSRGFTTSIVSNRVCVPGEETR